LAGGNHVRDNSSAFFHISLNDGSDTFAGEKAGDQCAGQVGAAAWFFGGAMKKMVDRGMDGLFVVVDEASGFPHLPKLNLGHHTQDVFLALEVVEEGAFADVRGLRDVFHGDVGKAALGKELEGAAKKAEPRFRGTALTATHALEMGQIFGGGCFQRSCEPNQMTVAHK